MLEIIARAQALLASRDDEGATAVEYGLMVALIAAVIVTVVTTLGLGVQGAFDHVADSIPWVAD